MSTPVATEPTQTSVPVPNSLDRPLHGPDVLGRFGSFGGRFVPETLMDALNQLAAAYEQAKADPEFQARLDGYLKHYVGRPSPLFHAERLTKYRGGRRDLPQARGPEPHRCAQDQQRHRPGHAGAADEQDPGDRRDRGRSARGRDGDGLCAFRHRMHGLHGRGRHPASEAQRLQHEDAGGDGRAGDDRLADLARRDQRSDARLDGLVADHALHDRQRGRPAPVSDDRPRLSVGDRPGDEGPVPRPDRSAARRRGGLRRRRFERGGDVRPVHRRRRGRADRRRGGRARAQGRRACRQPYQGPARHPARQLQLRLARRGRPDARRPLDLGGPRLSRRRARAQLLERPRPGPLRVDHRRRSPRRLQRHRQTRRHPSRPRVEPRRWPRPSRRPAASGSGKVLVVCLSGRGDKDAYEVARLRGEPI